MITLNLTMANTHFIPPTLRMQASQWQAQAGFTLVEIMAVVAIIGVIAAFGVPSYSEWRASQGVSSAASALMGHLKQARHLAIGENRSVEVLIASNQYTFDKTSVQQNIVTMTQFGSPALTATPADNTFTSRGTVVNSGNIVISAGTSCKQITINIIGHAYFATPPSPCP